MVRVRLPTPTGSDPTRNTLEEDEYERGVGGGWWERGSEWLKHRARVDNRINSQRPALIGGKRVIGSLKMEPPPLALSQISVSYYQKR